MMDIQESEEDMEKVKCERGGSHVTPSPAPSFLSVKSDQSMDRPIALNRGAQSYIGEKVRLDETPSPALSHLSIRSAQSMDRPIAFNNEKQNYMGERLRSDETPSPAPSHLSMRSDQSMDRPLAFNNGKQNYMGENLTLAEAPSPTPSHLSIKSDQSMDWPIAFRNGTPDTGLRLNKAPSPSASYFSLKSNQSMDRPIAFKDNTHPHSAKRLRLEETPSPTPSFQSMKSHQSMDRPIAFNSGTSGYTGLRQDEAPSPATSYLSLQSNQSTDRPIAFKDRTQTYGAKKVLHVAPSPAPSLISVKSDQSMDRPIAFSSRARNYMTESLNELFEATSPAPSLTSLKSEQSMDRPIAFRNEAHSHEFRSTLSATLLTEDHYRCSVCTEVFKDPVSIPCGHSYCKHCIEIYWSKPAQTQGYACPQCRKRFRDRPVLNVNQALTKVIEELLKAGFSPAIPAQCYAGPEDVPCDICTEMKLKAVKSCLSCTASYCENHIRQHYTVPALQRHNLVEVTESTQDSKDIKPFKEFQDRVIEDQQKEIRKLGSNFSEQSMTAMNEKTEYCHPVKCFCSLFFSNDLPMDVTEVAALGRHLELGMLYNCCNESFISGSHLWDNLILTSGRISWPQMKTHLKVLEDDSLKQRCSAFEMSPVLRVRALCGLIELSGAAAFLSHPIQTQHQDRATLHYKTTTRMDMVSQELLQQETSPLVVNSATATHVIIAVLYGTQAFFVFDNKRISTERNTEMENVIKKITTTLNARDVFSSLNETEKTNSILYDCSLYTDVGVWNSPVSFNKAVEICDSLPTLLGSKGEKAVPLKVWLYPLKKLGRNSVSAVPSGVSENMIHQAENVLEHLRKQIKICQDMLSDYDNLTALTWFPALTEKLQNFSEILLDYKTEFQRKTSEIIESINLNEDGVKHLQELIRSSNQSLFNLEHTKHWLEKKKTELEVLNGCRAANITIVKSQEELQRVISDPLVSSIFCFTISSMETGDSFLAALKKYTELMKRSTTSSDCPKPDSLQPLKIGCITEKVFSDLKAFIASKETNEEKHIKFIVASLPNDDCSELSVHYYHAGIIVSRNVELQSKPDLAQISQVKHNSLSLTMNNRQNRNIERYIIEYRGLGEGFDNIWKQVIFYANSVTETCVISGLKSGKLYQLRYLVIEQDCMSNFSSILNAKTDFSPIHGRPFVNKLSKNSVRLAWLKSEADDDHPVLQYMVEYKEAGLEGWLSVLTRGPECECTLTVPHSTCYRVRVSVVYREKNVSKPSEETPVPVDVWRIKLSKRKSSILLEVLKLQTEKKPVELIDWTDEESEVRGFLQCLPYISQLRFAEPQNKTAESWEKRKRSFILDLSLQAALHQKKKLKETVNKLLSSVKYERSDFLLDLCSYVKDYESQTGRSVLPALQPVYQSAPAVWRINLSERKSSILLEVLKLQTEKKPVELIDCTDEKSEVRGFLKCLPYISQLSFRSLYGDKKRRSFKFLVNLIVLASDFTTKKDYKEIFTSVCSYRSFPFTKKYINHYVEQSDFLLDLYSHVKNFESQTGRSVLPALQPVYQSAPAVWRIKLSERKSSILLKVLKLQTVKKPVELIDCTDEKSEVRGFLKCLPYISELGLETKCFDDKRNSAAQCILNLIVAASEFYSDTGENYTKALKRVCSYEFFPNADIYCENDDTDQCDFLLDLYSHVKDYESQTGRSVLPALQPVYQSAPAVWRINLSERKSSILLEVLKLQTEKKPVELIDLTDEECEVRGFLKCLPYISELGIPKFDLGIEMEERAQFLLNLTVEASKCVTTTGKNYIELLTSVCSYRSFVWLDDNDDDNDCYSEFQTYYCDFLLNLCSHVKDYESQTGRSVLPALQSVYQSPTVWRINLSERKSSILLEVLKLQTEKKPVELIDWTDEESEVRGFFQCLPYISKLGIYETGIDIEIEKREQFLLNLIVEASKCVTTTGENYIELFTSVCSYRSFVCFHDDEYYEDVQTEHCDLLLDLCSRVKDYESQTGRSVLPALQPIYKSDPAVWRIKLSERKSSILLEVLKLQTEKKPVELIDCTDEESELRGFLKCLPYISQLRFREVPVKFLLSLIVSASELDANTQGNYTELLTSACCYTSFPYDETDDVDYYQIDQCDFLLDLWSHVKDYESQTGRSVLPALQPVYQSAPAVWSIKLSKRKSSILLEVLKLQTEKKPVELIDCTDEESEVRGFLQCLPYISELRNADQHFPSMCKMFGLRVKADRVTPLLQALNFTVTLSGKLPSSTCRSVGRVLSLSPSKLNLTLKPRAISLRGLKLLFRHITHLQSLSLEYNILVKVIRALRLFNNPLQLTTEELSLITKDSKQNRSLTPLLWSFKRPLQFITNGSKQNSSHILSSLTSLLRLMSVQCLDLTQCKAEALSLTALLGLQDPLIIRFSKKALQQLVSVVYEAQDDELTCSFLKKTSKDLTSCSLTWEMIHYLLQQGAVNLKVDFRNSKINMQNMKELLPVLNKVQLKRLSPSFTLSIITKIYKTRSPQYVSSLMSSAGNYINLNGRVLDSVHCAALRFTLKHSNTVKLNLLWTSIPEEELKSFLPLLNRVSQLSVDRLLLLKLLHCCSSSDVQQEALSALFSALHNTLDLSCGAPPGSTDTRENQEHLKLTKKDSKVISSVLKKAQSVVKLVLQDCELFSTSLKQLLSILSKVQLSCSKALLLQFLACICKDGAERSYLRRTQALSQALGGEMDLSHTQMDQRSCEQLAVFLEYSEGLTELDLSHCKLTDQCMEPLLPHLHKTQTLDLSHNNITDESANKIHSIVSNHSNMQTVRLFGNRINDRKQFIRDKRFEIW